MLLAIHMCREYNELAKHLRR